MIMLLEKLKEGFAFAIIETPAFLDNESRNAQAEVIDVGYLSSFGNPPGRAIDCFVCRSSRICHAARSKVSL